MHRLRLAALGVAVSAMVPGGSAFSQTLPAPAGQYGLRLTQPGEAAVIPPPPPEDVVPGRVAREPTLPGLVPPTDDTETASIPPARPPATDLYEAVGIRAGSFVLYPSLTTGLGYTTNVAAAAGGSPSTFVSVAPAFSLRSDWTRHSATFDFGGSFVHYGDDTTDDLPQVAAVATGRIDASEMWTVPLVAAYRFTTQAISDPDFPAGVNAPPGVHDLRGSIGIARTGPAILQAEAKVERTIYDNGVAGNVVVDQSDRNNTVFGARLRGGYAVSASFAPFIEGELARRDFDQTVDNDGVRRAGNLSFLRGGVAIDRSPILTGEFAVGIGAATFDDPALSSIRALTVDGSLVWSPTALTTLTLNAVTTFNPSTDPTSAGSVVYDGLAELAYAWRVNVSLLARAAVRHERFQGTGEIDNNIHAGLGATWKLNRMLWLTGAYDHEWLSSTDPSRDFQSDTVRVELRAQR